MYNKNIMKLPSSKRTQTTQLHIDPGVIDLGVGQPQLSLLPIDLMRQAAEDRFASGESDFLQYGAEQGDGLFRCELARFLTHGYGFEVNPDDLFITNGASLSLDLICTLYSKPGDIVFIEEPSYFLALRTLENHGLKPVPIPQDIDGLSIEALERALQIQRPAFLYTIPTFQNPSGASLSLSKRLRLAEISQQYDLLVVADEVYHLLDYHAQDIQPLAKFSPQANIISLGSFSKILAPGLRLGWIQTSQSRAVHFSRAGLLSSGGGLNPFTSAIVRGILENGGLETNITKLKNIYRQRIVAMTEALSTHIPQAQFQVPLGGYFFWVRLPDVYDTQAHLPTAERYKVCYRPGAYFSVCGGQKDFVRLSFAYYPTDTLVEGVFRLGKSLSHRTTADLAA